MPIVLPHRLIPYLLENDLFAGVSDNEIEEYWRHLSQRVDWAKDYASGRAKYHPFTLWGDDAVYNSRQDKLVAVAMCPTLDNRPQSQLSICLLFCYRFDT